MATPTWVAEANEINRLTRELKTFADVGFHVAGVRISHDHRKDDQAAVQNSDQTAAQSTQSNHS